MQVIIGKVSTRTNARDHLDVHGRAHCGAGNGVTMQATRWQLDATVIVERICRRCIKALRRRLAEQAATGDQHSAGAAHMLAPADQAAAADRLMLSDMRRHLRAVHTPPQTPAELAGLSSDEFRRRLLAELADEVA
jgi:hypothetical protein